MPSKSIADAPEVSAQSEPSIYFVFDVESLGLHGMGFAVGYVVIDASGNELDSGYLSYQPRNGVPDWVLENVFPALWGWAHPAPDMGKINNALITEDYTRYSQFLNDFWDKWSQWKEKGARMVSDCAWPVEANFLSRCVNLYPDARALDGPYPLLDVSSVLLAAGKDPVGTFERRVGEMPAHNPLCDARQSARIFIQTLNEIKYRCCTKVHVLGE